MVMWRNAPAVRWEGHYGDRIVLCYAERPSTVDEMLASAAAECPDSIAFIDGERRRTFAELNAIADSIAGGLVARGVQQGDRVALLLDNCGEFEEAFFGILRAGAIAVPLNTREQQAGLEYLIGHAGIKLLIHESRLADRLPQPCATPTVQYRICVGTPVTGSEPFAALATAYAPNSKPVAEDAIATILYTSGTTGKPKGAMLTNLSIVTSVMNYQLCWELTENDRALMAAPVSHVTGLVAIMLSMVRARGTTLFMKEFKAARFLELAAAEGMTYTLLVPAMYNLCLLQANFGQYDLSRWRVGGYGGAPMPPSTIAQLARKLPWLELVNAYGATETTSPSTLMPLGEGLLRSESVGLPVPTAEIMIMNEDIREAPTGQSGEVWIRGGHVVCGYWRDEGATKEAFMAGFWKSGDVGLLTDDGYLRLLDRKRDLINRGGYKVYSAEVESVLMQHPNVAEAAVVPMPDPVLGEKSHAVVCLAGHPVDAIELQRFCMERLSDYKIPDFITFIEGPLPRNAAGKILKRELSRMLLSQSEVSVQAAD